MHVYCVVASRFKVLSLCHGLLVLVFEFVITHTHTHTESGCISPRDLGRSAVDVTVNVLRGSAHSGGTVGGYSGGTVGCTVGAQ